MSFCLLRFLRIETAARARRGAVATIAGWAAVLALSTAQAGEIRGRVTRGDGTPLRDAIVFVSSLPEGVRVPTPGAVVEMDQVDKQFLPSVLAVQAGAMVRFPNRDEIHHHVYSFSRTKNFEIPLYKGETPEPIVFDKPGLVKVGCNIHDWMTGYILVVPTPYFARSDEHGDYVIAGVPSGRLSVAVWHEHSGEKVPETVRDLEVQSNVTEASFVLALKGTAARAAQHGLRSYE